jgi:hypothetical protein
MKFVLSSPLRVLPFNGLPADEEETNFAAAG